MTPDNFRLDALQALAAVGGEQRKHPDLCEDYMAMLLYVTWQNGVIFARSQMLAKKEHVVNEAASAIGHIAATI